MQKTTGIRDFPAEILSIIFEFATQSIDHEYFGDVVEYYTVKYIRQASSPWENAIQLSLVCKSWRRHALQSPSLWTFISRVRVEHLKDILPRSQELPLVLWCSDNRSFPLKITLAASRLQELAILFRKKNNTEGHAINPDDANIHSVLESVQMPRISVLHLKAHDSHVHNPNSPIHAFKTQLIQRSHATLEHLVVRDCDMLLSWGSSFFYKLRKFEFVCSKDHPHDFVYRMLECMPNLEDLDVRLYSPERASGLEVQNVDHWNQLTLPHLKTLRLHIMFRHLIPLGRLVRCPSIIDSAYNIHHEVSGPASLTERLSRVADIFSSLCSLGSFGPSNQIWLSMDLELQKDSARITLSEDQSLRSSHADNGFKRGVRNKGMRLNINLYAYSENDCTSAIGSLQTLGMPTLTHLSIRDRGFNLSSYNVLEDDEFEQVHNYCPGFFESLTSVEYLEFSSCVFSAKTLGHIGPRFDSHRVNASSLCMPKLHTIVFEGMEFDVNIFRQTDDASKERRDRFLAPMIMLLKSRQELGSLKELIFDHIPWMVGNLLEVLSEALPGVTVTLVPDPHY